MRVSLHALADQDVEDAATHYDRQRRGLGAELIEEVARGLQVLAASPGAGAVLEDGIREYPLRRFPFTLIYSVEADVLFVYAVAHQRRRPGYWRGRL